MKNIKTITLILFIILFSTFSCSNKQDSYIVPIDHGIHTLRVYIETKGVCNRLSVDGRLMKDSVINYIYFDANNKKSIVFDHTYVFKVGNADYMNLDIFGQIPSPSDSIKLDYEISGKVYLDGRLIKDVTEDYGIDLDVYYDNYF